MEQLTLKTNSTVHLPLLLCGLAAASPEKASAAARTALHEYDRSAHAVMHHALATLCCQGPFRPHLEAMACGGHLGDLPEDFQHIICGLRFVSFLEDTIEGQHARVARGLQHARNRTFTYTSCRLRMRNIRANWTAQGADERGGFRDLLCPLIPCNPNDACAALGLDFHPALRGVSRKSLRHRFQRALYRFDPEAQYTDVTAVAEALEQDKKEEQRLKKAASKVAIGAQRHPPSEATVTERALSPFLGRLVVEHIMQRGPRAATSTTESKSSHVCLSLKFSRLEALLRDKLQGCIPLRRALAPPQLPRPADVPEPLMVVEGDAEETGPEPEEELDPVSQEGSSGVTCEAALALVIRVVNARSAGQKRGSHSLHLGNLSNTQITVTLHRLRSDRADWDTTGSIEVECAPQGETRTLDLSALPVEVLLKEMHRWSVASEVEWHLREHDSLGGARELLHACLNVGAFPGGEAGRTVTVTESRGEWGRWAEELEEKGLLVRSGDSDAMECRLTPEGAESLIVCNRWVDPQPCCAPLPGTRPSDMTTAELIFRVSELRFTFCRLAARDRVETLVPLTAAARECYLMPGTAPPPRRYLEVLAASEAFFHLGVAGIKHLQPDAYYAAFWDVNGNPRLPDASELDAATLAVECDTIEVREARRVSRKRPHEGTSAIAAGFVEWANRLARCGLAPAVPAAPVAGAGAGAPDAAPAQGAAGEGQAAAAGVPEAFPLGGVGRRDTWHWTSGSGLTSAFIFHIRGGAHGAWQCTCRHHAAVYASPTARAAAHCTSTRALADASEAAEHRTLAFLQKWASLAETCRDKAEHQQLARRMRQEGEVEAICEMPRVESRPANAGGQAEEAAGEAEAASRSSQSSSSTSQSTSSSSSSGSSGSSSSESNV